MKFEENREGKKSNKTEWTTPNGASILYVRQKIEKYMHRQPYDPLPDILAFHDYTNPWTESSRRPVNPEKISSGYFSGGILGNDDTVLIELARNERDCRCLIAALDGGADYPLYVLGFSDSDGLIGPIVAYENLNHFLSDQGLSITAGNEREPNKSRHGTA